VTLDDPLAAIEPDLLDVMLVASLAASAQLLEEQISRSSVVNYRGCVTLARH
jgi:hypothetical protein